MTDTTNPKCRPACSWLHFRIGKSFHYVIAPETGEILGIVGTK